MVTHVYRRKSNTTMGNLYRLAFYLWRRMPGSLQAVFIKSAVGKGLKIAGRDLLARFAGREDLYSAEYYSYVDAEASRSAPFIVASVLSQFAPRRLIDVGCGTGALLAEFNSRGVSGSGLEYSAAGLKTCRKRGLNVDAFDIESDERLDLGEFDLAICFEVAEHVQARFADRLVDLLVRFAPRVIFTAATPEQGGGADHVNEQPHEYWIARFEQRGYRMLWEITEQWRHDWSQKDVAAFYARNVMIFEKSGVT
jgi:SAM-dependent methyltransferase